MILSDSRINTAIAYKAIRVQGRTPEQIKKAIQPNSLDLHLGDKLRIYTGSPGFVYDPRSQVSNERYELIEITDEPYIMDPSQFLLAETAEVIGIDRELTACIEGISSVGRFGLFVVNAGRVESGWYGRLTLELLNSAEHHTLIYAGMRIGQMVFQTVDGRVNKPYDITGRYFGDMDVEASRAWMDYDALPLDK